MNRKQLQALAQTRLDEAKALLSAGFPDGAYYLAGYAVECALKACIAKQTQRHDFPDKKTVDSSYTHNLKELIRVANLGEELVNSTVRDPAFAKRWVAVSQWSERSRYERHSPESAGKLISAIGERRHGVLAWIKRRW